MSSANRRPHRAKTIAVNNLVQLTFLAAVKFSSQCYAGLPSDRENADELRNNWIFEVVGDDSVTVRVSSKNLAKGQRIH